MELAIYYAGQLSVFADKIGVSKSAIHRCKTGENVSVDTAERVLAFLEAEYKTWANKERVLVRTIDNLRQKIYSFR